MALQFRPAHNDDLELAEQLVVSSINDVCERHGFGKMATAQPTFLQQFSLNDDPDGLWIAEEDDRLLGFAFSWVSADLWFLAQLFIDPGQQGRGIGKELLQRTLAHAKARDSRTRALITFAFNRTSQALYIAHGLFPRLPIHLVSMEAERLSRRQQSQELRSELIKATEATIQNLVDIDSETLGVSREKHHRYLLNGGQVAGYAFYDGEQCIGYAYVGADGHIGPLSVKRTDYMPAALEAALGIAADTGAARVSAFIPGNAETALTTAMGIGMRITFPMVLASDREFGDWTRYLPRNPGLM